MNRTRLLKSSMSVSSLRLVGQVFALVSGLLIANFFGATAATDDYYTALILPAAVANLVINSLTNLFAPIYLQHIHNDPQQGSKILSSMTLVSVGSLLIGTLVCLLAVPLVTASRSLTDPSELERALLFGYLLVINCPVVGLARLLGVYSEAQQHYNVPAAVAILNPLVFIVVMVLALPLGIYSLLIANLTTSILEAAILFIFAYRNLDLRIRWTLTIHPAVREMLLSSFAPAVSYVALFFVPTIDRLLATSLSAGSLTAFHYGERLVVAFEALIISGPLLVIFYHWANTNATQGIQAVAYSLNDTVSLLIFVILPVCVGGALLSYPIISVLFGRGAFQEVETSAMVFAVLLVSQMFNFLIVLLTRLLVLIKLIRVQLILSVGVSALNTGLNFALIGPFGLEGIVFSTLLTRIIITGAVFYYVKRYIPDVSFGNLFRRIARTSVCLLLMVAVVILLELLFSDVLQRGSGLFWQIAALSAVIFAGALAYAAVAWLSKHGDLLALLHIIGQTRYGALLRRFGVPAES